MRTLISSAAYIVGLLMILFGHDSSRLYEMWTLPWFGWTLLLGVGFSIITSTAAWKARGQ